MAELGMELVECYSGHTYAQEPRAIVWQGRRYSVAQIERRWRSPEGLAFCVSAEMGERFYLHYHETERRWAIHPQTAGADLPGPAEPETRPQRLATGPTSLNHHDDGEALI